MIIETGVVYLRAKAISLNGKCFRVECDIVEKPNKFVFICEFRRTIDRITLLHLRKSFVGSHYSCWSLLNVSHGSTSPVEYSLELLVSFVSVCLLIRPGPGFTCPSFYFMTGSWVFSCPNNCESYRTAVNHPSRGV